MKKTLTSVKNIAYVVTSQPSIQRNNTGLESSY